MKLHKTARLASVDPAALARWAASRLSCHLFDMGLPMADAAKLGRIQAATIESGATWVQTGQGEEGELFKAIRFLIQPPVLIGKVWFSTGADPDRLPPSMEGFLAIVMLARDARVAIRLPLKNPGNAWIPLASVAALASVSHRQARSVLAHEDGFVKVTTALEFFRKQGVPGV